MEGNNVLIHIPYKISSKFSNIYTKINNLWKIKKKYKTIRIIKQRIHSKIIEEFIIKTITKKKLK